MTRSASFIKRRRAGLLQAAVVVALLVYPLFGASLYSLSVMTQAGFYAIMVIAVGLILGQGGQLSFGHGAFYGLGGYTVAVLTTKTDLPTWVALIAAAAIPAVIALIIGRPVLRLQYFYLALATIGLGVICAAIVLEMDALGGSLGLYGIPPLSLFGYVFDTYLNQYYLVWGVTILILLFTHRALRFRVGRSLRALATSEIAAKSLGLRTPNWKLTAFVFNAIYCGLAGALFAFCLGAISPAMFGFTASVLPIVMMLVGGDRTLWGGMIGAVAMTWLINSTTGIAEYSGVVYSVVMILLLIFLPAGIVGFFSPELRGRVVALFRRGRHPDVVEGAIAAEGGTTALQSDVGVALPSVAPLFAAPGAEAEPSGALLEDLARAKDKAIEGPLLEVEGITVAFGGLKAVNEVSLTVNQGEIAALIGPNGAGKTTLFNAVTRLQSVTEGRVRFAGEDITGLQPADAARVGLSRTFQNLRLFLNMNVLENVLVGCHRHEHAGMISAGLGLPKQRAEERGSRARAMDALTLVGLAEFAERPAGSLPYGQQRLVEIARALASEPKLLLLDEPAAGMNAEERAYLVERIARIRDAGITVFLVEHDIALVMGVSDSVSVLDYGRLIAAGTPEEVQKDEAVIAAYLGAEQDRGRDLCETRDLVDATKQAEPESLLAVQGLVTSYGSIEALHGVSFDVPKGEVLAVLGANGAGKTTLLETVSGLLRPKAGRVTYQGADITKTAPEKIVARGLCHVPEGRQLFPSLSVRDNLLVGTAGRKRRDKTALDDEMGYVFDVFPVLGERRKQAAGTLSGGEQQMLAIGRALMGKPTLLLLDEPSMGLAPMTVERIFEALAKLNADGLTMLMVEQNAEMALSLAHRAIALQTGYVVLSGLATELREDERVRECYLGQAQGTACVL